MLYKEFIAETAQKQMTEPYQLDTDMLESKDRRQMLVGIGCFALAQVLKETVVK